jgi:hypothetical protein
MNIKLVRSAIKSSLEEKKSDRQQTNKTDEWKEGKIK